MNGELTTIRTAYEEEGMSPAEIAEDRELDLAAVKSALMSCSSKYRKDAGREAEDESLLNFSFEEKIRVKNAMMDLAMGADDEHLRGKMLTTIRDDYMGRKDMSKGLGGMNVNILNINRLMQQVRGAADSVKQKVISV